MEYTDEEIEKYVIVCDESEKFGKSYSFFYGGAIVKESDYDFINQDLELLRKKLVLKELKRTYIDSDNAHKYITVLERFFTFVSLGKIKVRVMFTDNSNLDKSKISNREDETFSKFYYLFIRYAFSLFYSNKTIDLRLIFDELPDKKSVNNNFKEHLVNNLTNTQVIGNKSRILLSMERIEEVDSKKHVILQCCDVIVGLMDYYLNSYVSDNVSGKKEKGRIIVLRYILENIEKFMGKNFDRTSTTYGVLSNRGWQYPYAHFLYKPKVKKIKKKYNYIEYKK